MKGGVPCPDGEEFKYLQVLFTSEGRIEQEIDRLFGVACAGHSALVRRGEERAEPKSEALNLPVDLCSYHMILCIG